MQPFARYVSLSNVLSHIPLASTWWQRLQPIANRCYLSPIYPSRKSFSRPSEFNIPTLNIYHQQQFYDAHANYPHNKSNVKVLQETRYEADSIMTSTCYYHVSNESSDNFIAASDKQRTPTMWVNGKTWEQLLYVNIPKYVHEAS